MLFTRLSGLLSLVLTAGLPAFAEPVLIARPPESRADPKCRGVRAEGLLLLRSDPLASVEAWNGIESVILRGEVIPRESLAAVPENPTAPSGSSASPPR